MDKPRKSFSTDKAANAWQEICEQKSEAHTDVLWKTKQHQIDPALLVIRLHGLELESEIAGIRVAKVAGTP